MSERNVLGGELESCSTDPMTGFLRDGTCTVGPQDAGLHAICAVMTEEFLAHQRSVGNDLSTLPNFPAEIRAPAGTLPGVSSFQLHFADHDVLTPGDHPDVLVAMNPAALKANLADLVHGGLLIVDTLVTWSTSSGFSNQAYDRSLEEMAREVSLHVRPGAARPVFEMPVLGYLGYPPFALAADAFWRLFSGGAGGLTEGPVTDLGREGSGSPHPVTN